MFSRNKPGIQDGPLVGMAFQQTLNRVLASCARNNPHIDALECAAATLI